MDYSVVVVQPTRLIIQRRVRRPRLAIDNEPRRTGPIMKPIDGSS